MQDIDPNTFRNFMVVAEVGSLTRAAKVAGITIAALSFQIKRLETALGQKLFERNGRGMVLSQHGGQFLQQARSLLQFHDQIINKKQSSSSRSSVETLIENAPKYRRGNGSAKQIDVFEDHLESPLFKNVFSIWKNYRADGKALSLDDLTKRNLVSFERDNLILASSWKSPLRVMGASQELARLFQLSKHGFGITAEEMWKSAAAYEPRRKIFSMCEDMDVPVFFTGNAPIPWHSDHYAKTINQLASTKLDRLLLPVKVSSETGDYKGVLQLAEFRGRVDLPSQESSGATDEERAANLNFIGHVAVAI